MATNLDELRAELYTAFNDAKTKTDPNGGSSDSRASNRQAMGLLAQGIAAVEDSLRAAEKHEAEMAALNFKGPRASIDGPKKRA